MRMMKLGAKYGLIVLMLLASLSVLAQAGLPSLRPDACGQSGVQEHTRLWATPQASGDTLYRFRVFDGEGYDAFIDVPDPVFALDYLPVPIKMGRQYQVKIAWLVNGNESPYGSTCNITTALPSTALAPVSCGASFPSLSSSLRALIVEGAVKYSFELSKSGYLKEVESAMPYVALKQFLGISYGEQYQVRVRAKIGEVWADWGRVCSISIDGTPSTSLREQFCNKEMESMNMALQAYPVDGATSYRFVVLKDGTDIDEAITAANSVYAGNFKNITYGGAYDIRVDVLVGGVWHEGKNLCHILPPQTVPQVRIKEYFCGGLYDGDDVLDIAPTVWLDEYEYQLLDNAGTVLNTVKHPYAGIKLMQFGSVLKANTVYSLRVRARSGNLWGSYGAACDFTTKPLPPIVILPSQCGITPQNLNFSLEAQEVTGASWYKFRFYDATGVLLEEVDRSYPFVPFSMLKNIAYGKTYTVKVAYNLHEDWSEYGQPCSITTPNIPATALQSYYCGATLDDFSALLRAVQVPLASKYIFGLFDTNNTLLSEIESDYPWLPLSDFNDANFSTIYSIKVKVKSGENMGSYGGGCSITTPAYPGTQLLPYYCDKTYYTMSSRLYAKPVAGADQYSFALFNAMGNTLIKEDTSSNNSILLGQFSGISYKEKYTVKVKARIGRFWGSYGEACRIEIDYAPTTQIRAEFFNISIGNTNSILDAYPINGATSYSFALYSTSNTSKVLIEAASANPSINLQSFGNKIMYGQSYLIRVKANSSKDYGVACPITLVNSPSPIPTTPPARIRAEYCGVSPSDLYAVLRAYPITNATGYKFALYPSSGTSPIEVKESSSPAITWQNFTTLHYATSYTVKVSAFVNGQWTEYGSGCTYSMPNIPAGAMSSEYCGIQLSSAGDVLRAVAVPNASAYIFGLFENGLLKGEASRSGLNIRLSDFAQALYGHQYELKVRIRSGSNEGVYGAPCLVKMPPIPSSQLSDEFCGISVQSLSVMLSASPISLAKFYIFGLFDASGREINTVRSNIPRFLLSDFGGIGYNSTYQIAVKLEFADGSVGQYGTKCSINTPSIPTTMLRGDQCGQSWSSPWYEYFKAYRVEGATAYRFKIHDNANNQLVADTSCLYNWLPARDIRGIQYNKSYRIEVAAIVGSAQGAFGSSCTLSVGPIPSTSLQDVLCGVTLEPVSIASLKAYPVAYATEYIFALYDATGVQLVEEQRSKGSSISLQAFKDITYSTSYLVKVKAVVGNEQGSYGASCLVKMPTLPATSVQSHICGMENVEMDFAVQAYAVPGADSYVFGLFSSDSILLDEEESGSPSIAFGKFELASPGLKYLIGVRVIVSSQEAPYSALCPLKTAENIPLVPKPLTAIGISASEIRLQWADASFIEDHYAIEIYDRAIPGFRELFSTLPNATEYIAQQMASNTSYTFRVRAVAGEYRSAYSNWAVAKTQSIQLFVPNGQEVLCSGGILPISWTGAPLYGEESINIRLVSQSGTTMSVATAANKGLYNWKVPSGMDGYYKMHLYDASANLLDESDGYFQIATGCIQPYLGQDKMFAAMDVALDEYYHETQGPLLCFSLPEQLFNPSAITSATIYNWHREPKGQLNLVATYGYNNYMVDMRDSLPLNDGEYYTLEVKDMAGQSHILRFIKTEPEQLKITVDPYARFWSCNGEGPTVVDFETSIEGGVGPYQVEWKIAPTLEEAQNNLESLRKQEKVKKEGKGVAQGQSWLRVEEPPGYYLVFYVKDACGKESEQMLLLTCAPKARVTNTLNVKVIDFSGLINNK